MKNTNNTERIHSTPIARPPMASHATSGQNVPVSAVVDPAFWPRDMSDSSSMTLHFSPGASSTTQESSHGGTPPAQTPRSDSTQGGRNGQNGHNARQDSQQAASARTSVAVACLPCRNRHLKCDGGVRCSRCKLDGVDCTYVKSRRGWKGKRKTKAGETGPSAASVPGLSPLAPLGIRSYHTMSNTHAGQINGNGTILQSPINTNLPAGTIHLRSPEYSYHSEYSLQVDTSNNVSNNHVLVANPSPVVQYNLDGTQRPVSNGSTPPRDAISAFYSYFYNAHPFCLPRERLLDLFQERRTPLLELAVQYIGSSFLPAVPTEMYDQALERYIQNQSYPKDGYSLQALLLFSIGLHANNKVPRAAQIFQMAQALTLDLGVHRFEFAQLNGHNDRVLEESWRRTWWSMYVVNGMMRAVNPGVQFTLKDVSLEVPLPCEDYRYLSGVSTTFPSGSLPCYMLPIFPTFSSFPSRSPPCYMFSIFPIFSSILGIDYLFKELFSTLSFSILLVNGPTSSTSAFFCHLEHKADTTSTSPTPAPSKNTTTTPSPAPNPPPSPPSPT